MSSNILKFASDTKARKQWFTGISFSHPAKMSLPLQIWLVENYSKVGDTVLDPMAGSGTILTACSLGRNVIAVELESKFIEIMKGNWAKIQQRGAQMGYSMGTCQIIQGDARRLEDLFRVRAMLPIQMQAFQYRQLADQIITSPPFFNTSLKKKFKSREELEEFARNTKLYKEGRSLEAVVRMIEFNWNEGEPENPDNIGSLPYGSIDKVIKPEVIITSPPYEGSLQSGKDGIDDSKWTNKSQKSREQARSIVKGYTGKADHIITSPPYEEGLGHKDTRPTSLGMPRPHYTEDPKAENIGNLKSDNYLSAMKQVYAECFAVLKDGGLLILVLKNFIRSQKLVRLDNDTQKLCEDCGFVFQERWYRKLPAQSFWRILYKKKYPKAPTIDFEDVLVFAKKEKDKT